MTNELTVTSGTSIEAYGDRSEINEVADRLMLMHPEAGKVGINGMRAVAQLAIMSGANPLPSVGEIYVWQDYRTKAAVVDFGVAYYRRIASEKDTVLWFDEPRPMTDSEREAEGVAGGTLASICKGYLLSEYERLLSLSIPWQEAQKILARTSTATVEKDEMFYAKTSQYHKEGDPISPPKGRTWQWVANKRAEKGFYRMKSLVDTTLTEQMKAQANRTLSKIKGEIIDDGLSVAEINGQLFGDNIDVVDGEVMTPPHQPEAQPVKVIDTFEAGLEPMEDLREIEVTSTGITEQRQWLVNECRDDSIVAGKVNRAATMTGLYNHVNRAMNAAAKWDKITAITPGTKLTCKQAIDLFDWLIERKQA